MTGGQSATLSNENPKPEGISGRHKVTEISSAMADVGDVGLGPTGSSLATPQRRTGLGAGTDLSGASVHTGDRLSHV